MKLWSVGISSLIVAIIWIIICWIASSCFISFVWWCLWYVDIICISTASIVIWFLYHRTNQGNLIKISSFSWLCLLVLFVDLGIHHLLGHLIWGVVSIIISLLLLLLHLHIILLHIEMGRILLVILVSMHLLILVVALAIAAMHAATTAAAAATTTTIVLSIIH